MSLRVGNTVTINNELGLVLKLVRWDDDMLEIRIESDEHGLVSSMEFGIAGHIKDLQDMFKEVS